MHIRILLFRGNESFLYISPCQVTGSVVGQFPVKEEGKHVRRTVMREDVLFSLSSGPLMSKFPNSLNRTAAMDSLINDININALNNVQIFQSLDFFAPL